MFTRHYYLHVSYQSGDGKGRMIVGDTLLKVKEGTTIVDIRKIILQNIVNDEPQTQWQSPTILGIDILPKRLYKSLSVVQR